MKRVRAFFESIVFAGLKPGGPKTHETQPKPPGAIRGTLERFLHAGGSPLLGVVKNTTAHEISGVDLTIDLTDATGSQVGAVTVAVEKVPPSSTKTFQYPIKQHEAAFALVREIATR